jgi:hypothetical protein
VKIYEPFSNGLTGHRYIPDVYPNIGENTARVSTPVGAKNSGRVRFAQKGVDYAMKLTITQMVSEMLKR